MALFFDHSWFDARLAERGLTRSDAARALGLSDTALDELWKDQREVLPDYVAKLAFLLERPEAEVRERAGVQGPPLATARTTAAPAPADPAPEDVRRRLARIEERLDRLESELMQLKRKRAR